MTELVKQLEDKKKGCGCITAGNEEFGTMNCGDIWGKWDEDKWIDDKKPTYCNKCKAEIAILEQAIAEIKSNDDFWADIVKSSNLECSRLRAEMQKQRQEILDKIRLEFHTFREEFIESELDIEDFDIGNLLYNIEQQLNQPKEEAER